MLCMNFNFVFLALNRSKSIKRMLPHMCLSFLVLSTLVICLCTLNYGHNWGGDFSAYIMQAKSINQFSTNEFIKKNRITIEQSSTRIGPVAYPWGFPIMLAPIYATFGLHLFALKMVGVLSYLGFLVYGLGSCFQLFCTHTVRP